MNAPTAEETSKEGTSRVQIDHPDWSNDAMADFRQMTLREYAVDGTSVAEQMDTVLFMSDPGMLIISGRMPGAEQFIEASLSGKREFGVVDAAALGDVDLTAASFTFENTPDAPLLKEALDQSWGHNKKIT